MGSAGTSGSCRSLRRSLNVFPTFPSLLLHVLVNLVENELRAVGIGESGKTLMQQFAIRPKRVDGGRQRRRREFGFAA